MGQALKAEGERLVSRTPPEKRDVWPPAIPKSKKAASTCGRLGQTQLTLARGSRRTYA
jgi:hypothetical protein